MPGRVGAGRGEGRWPCEVWHSDTPGAMPLRYLPRVHVRPVDCRDTWDLMYYSGMNEI